MGALRNLSPLLPPERDDQVEPAAMPAPPAIGPGPQRDQLDAREAAAKASEEIAAKANAQIAAKAAQIAARAERQRVRLTDDQAAAQLQTDREQLASLRASLVYRVGVAFAQGAVVGVAGALFWSWLSAPTEPSPAEVAS